LADPRGRGLFGVAPYRGGHRSDANAFYKNVIRITPPRIPFLQTPDPVPPLYNITPSRDASVAMPPNTRPDVIPIIHFVDTPVPYPSHPTVLSWVRATAGDQPAPVQTPPVIPFLMTDFLAKTAPLIDGSAIIPSLITPFDPLGGGAFIATAVPFRTSYPFADASVVIQRTVPPALTLPVNLRTFTTLLSYQSPHRQDASLLIPQAGIAGSVSLPVPLERQLFFKHEFAWRLGPNYAYDASTFWLPQLFIRQVPPPGPGRRKHALYMRRLELLDLRPAPHWMPKVDE
jgi:hypothetical protein